MFLKIIFIYIVVSIVISLIFGTTVSSSLIIKKVFKKDRISPYLFQLWSLILFIIIGLYYKPNIPMFNTHNLLSWKNILLIFMAVVPTSIIAYQDLKIKPTSPLTLIYFLDGASMEIPMRLLVQNLFIILGANVFDFYSLSLEIFLNAIVWVQFIIVQEVIGGRKITNAILPKIISSFWFSIWVGILYKDTGNIIIPMLAHGSQRILTYKISQKLGNQNPSETRM